MQNNMYTIRILELNKIFLDDFNTTTYAFYTF